MQTYYIYKGSKKLDSFHLNDYPIRRIHYTDKTVKEKDFKLDNLGFFERVIYNKIFPIRKNSCICFNSESEAKDYINHAIISINIDDRFSLDVKIQLLHYLQSLKIAF
jgi:hypothetical protein